MSGIPDLSPCSALPVSGEHLLAVGWVSKLVPLHQGSTPVDVYMRLQEFARQPLQPFVAMGLHECDLCQFVGDRGKANLFIPYRGKIYICPELITHYINAHHYQPPPIFCEAVLACPPLDSMAYKRLLIECGGKVLWQTDTE